MSFLLSLRFKKSKHPRTNHEWQKRCRVLIHILWKIVDKSQFQPGYVNLSSTVARAHWPVDSYSSQGEHAGRADEQVKQSGEVTPHHPEHPLSPDWADGHERQHQHGQQQVGQRQAEHKLVAGRQQVRPAIQGDHDQEIPQAGEQRDGHDGDRLQGSQTLAARHRRAVPTAVHGELLGHWTGEETVGDC